MSAWYVGAAYSPFDVEKLLNKLENEGVDPKDIKILPGEDKGAVKAWLYYRATRKIR